MFKNKFAGLSMGQAQREKAIVYKRVFNSEDGKIVLMDLMSRYHILNGHKGDVHAEGQRSVVLDIMKRCHLDIKELDKLLEGK